MRDHLADLGVDVEAPKVSNVLGYWFAREELQRRRKGVYYYPLSGAGLPHHEAEDEPDASPRSGRPRAADRNKGQAIPGPETEDSGDTTRGQEVTRRAG